MVISMTEIPQMDTKVDRSDGGQRDDCLVVGAGVAGVCAALFLQRAGARVAIVDPGAPGSGASFGNAGIVVNTKLMPVFAGLTPRVLLRLLRDPSSPLNVRWSRFLGLTPWFLRMLSYANESDVERITGALAQLCQNGERAYAELWRDAGMGDLVQARGNLALHIDEEDRDRDWEESLGLLRSLGVPMERAGAGDVRRLAAAVGSRYTCGIYSPDVQHTVDPQAFVSALFRLFERRGGRHRRAGVRGLLVQGGRATGVRTADGAIEGGSVVLAAGTGSAALAAGVGEPVPHQAVGGYHVVLGEPGIALDTPILPLDFRFAITPMRAGIRLAGTYEFGGGETAASESAITDMLAHVVQVLPGINAARSSVWRGFRSYLPDGLPVISASREIEGLFYLFGLSSSGMINGAASGRALARLWSGEADEFAMSPYAIDRFRKSPAHSVAHREAP